MTLACLLKTIGRRQKEAGGRKARAADERIKLTHEAVQGAKALKLHGWEASFGEAIGAARAVQGWVALAPCQHNYL